MKIFMNKYTFHARFLPTVLGIIPFIFIFGLLPISSTVLKVLSTGALSIALTYFVMNFAVRLPAKMFEEWLFSNGLKMPTTQLLMYSNDEYQDKFKDEIRNKIFQDFNIKIPSKKSEIEDEKLSRRCIKDVIKLIIGKVKDGHLLLKHNYEYGFFRNLWASSLLGLVGSLILIFISIVNNLNILMWSSIGLFVAYCLYMLFGHLIIKYTGKLYAKKLIEEYFSQNN